ncbi:MAG: hypothetical protein KBD12_00665 [Candidatus Pacebacteria bacterium]|nr:hypothetical protein [Candidatus Paceibacterota bacterium]
MNTAHEMDMPKEQCPFITNNNLVCGSIFKKGSDLLDNFILNNLINNSLLAGLILLSIYIYIFYNYLLIKLKNIKQYKISILLKMIFSDGILNSKAF